MVAYHLGLDAADHICMMSGTEKGHRCRQYFIDYRNKGGRIPYHLERYLLNRRDCFSMLSEMSIMLMAPMESAGYRLPAHLVPDISVGKGFSRYLRHQFQHIPFSEWSFPEKMWRDGIVKRQDIHGHGPQHKQDHRPSSPILVPSPAVFIGFQICRRLPAFNVSHTVFLLYTDLV